MAPLSFISSSAQKTEKIGETLGKILHGGAILSLQGDLGSGKTQFVKGLARGLGISQEITSPTFAIVQIYRGRLELYHVDLYRLNEKEVAELGLEEGFKPAADNSIYNRIYAIEWGERATAVLPAKFPSGNHCLIRFKILSESSRNITIQCPTLWLKKLQKFWR